MLYQTGLQEQVLHRIKIINRLLNGQGTASI
jgi:hypothetical protein